MSECRGVIREVRVGLGLFLVVAAFLLMGLVGCNRESKENRQFKIGLITNNKNGLKNIQGFRDGLAKFGYVEGQNVTYLSEGKPLRGERLETGLRHLIEAGVDMIFTAGTPTGVAAYRLTKASRIPVVFGVIADPIAAGVITDLTQPGENITGIRLSPNQARRLELLLEIAPEIKRIYIPYDPNDAASSSALVQVRHLAPSLNIDIVEGRDRTNPEVDSLLAHLPSDIQAIFLVPGTTVNARLADILAIALQRRLPISAPSTIQVEQGALTAYGFIHYQVGIQAARIADQVLQGASPGVLPVETAEFFFAVNLKTAQSIGREISYEILQKADIIIRNVE